MDESPTTTDLVELRQYRLHAGQRDTLIDLFDREFVETQEAVGMAVLGQFRDPRRPDHFVWLRGFPDMIARHESLSAFYDGPVWALHRDAANATMIDSDDVFLLRPAGPSDRLPWHQPERRDWRRPGGSVAIVIDHVVAADDDTVGQFRSEALSALESTSFRTIGLYTTTTETNSFTRLPVRADHAIVWIGATTDADHTLAALPPLPRRRQDRHVLVPTSRSALDGSSA